jgi:MoxR-like ATPase
LPFADEQILDYVTDFLQLAHEADERYTVRDGINIARFALKLISMNSGGHYANPLKTAILQTLGEEALRYARR